MGGGQVIAAEDTEVPLLAQRTREKWGTLKFMFDLLFKLLCLQGFDVERQI